jgi:hypothetical protein
LPNEAVAKPLNAEMANLDIEGKVVPLSDSSYSTASPSKDFFVVNKFGPCLVETQTSNMSIFDLGANQWSSKLSPFDAKTDNKQRGIDIFSMNSIVFMVEAIKKEDAFGLQLSYWDNAGGQFKKVGGEFQATIMSVSYIYVVTTVPDQRGNVAYMAITSTKATEGEAVFVKMELVYEASSPIKFAATKIGSITLGHTGIRCQRWMFFNSGSRKPDCMTWNKYQPHDAAFDDSWPSIGYLAINDNTLYAFVRYYDDKKDDEDIDQVQGPWAKGKRAQIPRYSWLTNGIWLLDFNTVLTINLDTANSNTKPNVPKLATRDDYFGAYLQSAVIKNRLFVFDRQYFEDRSDKMAVWAYKFGENMWSSIGDFTFPADDRDYMVAYDQTGDKLYLKKEDAGLYVTRMKN